MSDFSQETLLQRSEYGDANYPVAIVDPDRAGNSLARRMTRAILREVLGRLSFGTSLPSDHVVDDLFYLTAAGTLETWTKKLARTGETSATVSDFGDAEVGIYSGTFRMAADSTDAAFFTALGSGDKIILHPESGSDVVLSLSGVPTTGSRNSHATVNVASSDYTLTGDPIEDDTSYTVYAMTSRSEVKGSIFTSDGVFWRRELENTGAHIADDSVTLAKLAGGTAGNVIGYDASGDPADVGGSHLVALLAALTGASRLSYTSLKDTPTIPVDTTLWRGTYAVSTAYAAGDIVLHSGDLFLFTASVADTNTEADPGNVAGAEQIDVGAAGDVTGVSESAGTVTVTQRDGTTTTFSLQVGTGTLLSHGAAFPSSPISGQVHELTADASALERWTRKLTRTGETSTTVSEFGDTEVGIYSNTLVIAASSGEASDFTALGSGDKIVLRASGGTEVVFTLTGSPTTSTRNSHATVEVSSSDYTLTGTIADGTSYTVYAIRVGAEVKGSRFQSDGTYWQRIFENTLVANNIPDDLITRAMLAGGTAGKLLGFDSSGDSAEIDPFRVSAISDTLTALAGADHFVVSDESATDDPNKKISWTNLVAAIVAALAALTGDDRLSYTALKDGLTGGDITTLLEALTGSNQLDYTKLKNRPTATSGIAFPTSPAPQVGDTHRLTGNSSSLTHYTQKVTRVAEDSTTETDFDSNEVSILLAVFPSTYTLYLSVVGAEEFTHLGDGDQIVFVPAAGDTVTLTLSGTPTQTTRNGHACIQVSSLNYTIDGSLTDGTSYTVYAVERNRQEWTGTVFEFDGRYWGRVGVGAFRVSSISDALTAVAGVDHFVISDESETNTPNKKITWTNLVSAIVTALEALTGTNRLSYHGLKSVPTYGGAFPASPVADDIHILTADSAALTQVIAKITRTGELGFTDLALGDVYTDGSGNYYLSVGSDSVISDLESGDQIVHIREGVKQTITLTADPSTSTQNGEAFINLSSSQYTGSVSVSDEQTYTVYIVQSDRQEYKGAVFEFDGDHWHRVVSGEPSVGSVQFGDDWIQLYSDSSLRGFTSVNTDEDLDAGASFDDYSMIAFKITNEINSVRGSKWTYIPRATFRSGQGPNALLLHADNGFMRLEAVDSNTFKITDVSNMGVHEIRGHK